MVSRPDVRDLECVSMTFYAIAVLITSLRLHLRARKRMWWWDDSFALFGMITMTSYVAGTFLFAQEGHIHWNIRISVEYLLNFGYYLPIWSSRLSILLTIIRFAPWRKQRKILWLMFALFIFQWAFLLVETIWVCEVAFTAWISKPGALCSFGTAVPITQVLATVISDMVLIVAPLWILRAVRVNSVLSFCLLSVFSVSVATTLAALAHAILSLVASPMLEAIAAAVEIFVALTACNATVLIPAIFRKIANNEANSEGPNRTVMTIGGSNRKRDDAVAMDTLEVNDLTSSGVRVDVIVFNDQEQQTILMSVREVEDEEASYQTLEGIKESHET